MLKLILFVEFSFLWAVNLLLSLGVHSQPEVARAFQKKNLGWLVAPGQELLALSAVQQAGALLLRHHALLACFWLLQLACRRLLPLPSVAEGLKPLPFLTCLLGFALNLALWSCVPTVLWAIVLSTAYFLGPEYLHLLKSRPGNLNLIRFRSVGKGKYDSLLQGTITLPVAVLGLTSLRSPLGI